MGEISINMTSVNETENLRLSEPQEDVEPHSDIIEPMSVRSRFVKLKEQLRSILKFIVAAVLIYTLIITLFQFAKSSPEDGGEKLKQIVLLLNQLLGPRLASSQEVRLQNSGHQPLDTWHNTLNKTDHGYEDSELNIPPYPNNNFLERKGWLNEESMPQPNVNETVG